jgi:S-adenosylmethionine hydrolase
LILTFTDFGVAGSYTGELRAVLHREAPEVPVSDLVTDAAAFRPDLAAYLLGALAGTVRTGDVLLAVVDPGVGGARRPLAIELDGRWFVGPDNGLFELILRRHGGWTAHEIVWRPRQLSASFHGRDLFAPVTARLVRGDQRGLHPIEPLRCPDWPDDLARIVAVDGYGNAITGTRASSIEPSQVVEAAGRRIASARTFGDVPPREAFWYENSTGLVEIAANRASASQLMGLTPGAAIAFAC